MNKLTQQADLMQQESGHPEKSTNAEVIKPKKEEGVQ